MIEVDIIGIKPRTFIRNVSIKIYHIRSEQKLTDFLSGNLKPTSETRYYNE